MTISLIIPTYKRFDCLLDTLNSLMGCEIVPDEVIISDQNDAILFQRIDENIDRYRSCSKGSSIVWKHIYCKEIGSSVSRNVGLKTASGDIVVFTDDDVHYPKDFFRSVLSLMKNDKVAMIGGVDYNSFPTPQRNILKRIFLTLTGLNGSVRKRGSVSFGVFGKYPSTFEKAIQTEWAMGYCMVFRRQLLLRSDLRFDEKLTKYGYGEDLELTHLFYLWCKKNGFKCLLSPDLGVFHMVSSENRPARELSFLKIFINRRYINSVFHGNSLLHRLGLGYSNLWYVFFNLISGSGKDVVSAYRNYMRHCKQSRSLRDDVIS